MAPQTPATSSERDVPKTRNFISQLANPDWLVELVRNKGGDVSACKVMDEKTVTPSDTDKHLNRFMIPNEVMEDIKPMLSVEELEAANLTSNRRICGGEGQYVGRKRGREHHGLKVMVYNRSGLDCFLYLTKWDAASNPVLKGENYKKLRDCLPPPSPLHKVEMWAFRDKYNNLCFVIENKSA